VLLAISELNRKFEQLITSGTPLSALETVAYTQSSETKIDNTPNSPHSIETSDLPAPVVPTVLFVGETPSTSNGSIDTASNTTYISTQMSFTQDGFINSFNVGVQQSGNVDLCVFRPVPNNMVIQVQSAGYLAGSYYKFYLNNREIKTIDKLTNNGSNRGINVVAIDETLNVIFAGAFDTHGILVESDNFIAKIQGLPTPCIVLLAINDEATRTLSEDAKNLIESLGGLNIRQVKFRDSYALIGHWGFNSATAVESYAAQSFPSQIIFANTNQFFNSTKYELVDMVTANLVASTTTTTVINAGFNVKAGDVIGWHDLDNGTIGYDNDPNYNVSWRSNNFQNSLSYFDSTQQRKYHIQATYTVGFSSTKGQTLGNYPVSRKLTDSAACCSYLARGLSFTQDACVIEFRVFALEPGTTNLCVYRPSGSESNTYNLVGRSPAVLAPGLNVIPSRINVKSGDTVGWQDNGKGTISFDYKSGDNVSWEFNALADSITTHKYKTEKKNLLNTSSFLRRKSKCKFVRRYSCRTRGI